METVKGVRIDFGGMGTELRVKFKNVKEKKREASHIDRFLFQPWVKPNASKSGSVESVNVCTELKLWYTHIWDDVKRKLQLVLLENGTQFTYQTTRIIVEFVIRI